MERKYFLFLFFFEFLMLIEVSLIYIGLLKSQILVYDLTSRRTLEVCRLTIMAFLM